jgi:hypothetical protein
MKNLIRIALSSILLLTGIFSLAYAQEAQQGTGSISGRITVNGNPGRGVVVLVFYEGKDKNEEPRSFADVMSRITRLTCGEDGSFHLTNLEAGRYGIAAYAPALVGVPKSASAGAEEKKPANNEEEAPDQKTPEPESNTRDIALADGEKVEDVDFTLARGGVITGRVTYEDDSPAIGVTIKLTEQPGNKKNYRLMSMEFDGNDAMQMKTDDRGIYRVYGLPDGRYKISAAGKSGEAMQVLASNRYRRRTFYPSVTDEASAGIVEINNGSEARDIDIKFADPAKSYNVSGRVVAADTNRAVPNAPVTFISQTSGNDLPPARNFTTSNSKGEFKFEGIPAGSYTLLSPRGMPMPDGAIPEVNYDYYSMITKFEVKDSDVRGLTVRLQPGITIAGSVVIDGGDSGLLSQTPGLGLYAGVQPSGPEAETNVIPGGSFADVNPDGSFLLRGLSPGRANFSLHSRGDNAPSLQILRVEGSHVTDGRTIYLQSGDSLNDVRIIVAAANCTVKGQVKVAGTMPKDAEIQISARKVNAPKKNTDDDEGDDDAETIPDANGNFVINGLLAGQYEIVAEVVIGYSKEGKPIMREAKQMVSLSGGQEATVMLVIDLK